MKKKRSKFLTFLFSLIPGAGQMFMGFMKTGLSLMSIFAVLIFLSSWLNIGPLLIVLPVLWFYSFFDCINKRYSNDEEFAVMEDKYLFSFDKLNLDNNIIFQKRRLFAGTLLLLLGAYLIINNIVALLYRFIPNELYYVLNSTIRLSPQIVLGIAIIIIGARLIIGKKRESGYDA